MVASWALIIVVGFAVMVALGLAGLARLILGGKRRGIGAALLFGTVLAVMMVMALGWFGVSVHEGRSYQRRIQQQAFLENQAILAREHPGWVHGQTIRTIQQQSAPIQVQGDAHAVLASEPAASPPVEMRAPDELPDAPPADMPADAVAEVPPPTAVPTEEPAAENRAVEEPHAEEPAERPAWVENPKTGLVGDVYTQVVTVGPYASRFEVERNVEAELEKAAAVYVTELLGHEDARRVRLSGMYVRGNLVADRYWETIQPSFGVPMEQEHLLVQYGPDVAQKVFEEFRAATVRDRLGLIGIAALGVLGLLVTAFGYLKSDLATGGSRRWRLRLVAGLALIALLTVLLFLVRFARFPVL